MLLKRAFLLGVHVTLNWVAEKNLWKKTTVQHTHHDNVF